MSLNHIQLKTGNKETPVRRLEAITVCVDYSDFLAETLPENLRHFDHYVVVTSYEDTQTQDLCSHLGVECHATDVMYKDALESRLQPAKAGTPAVFAKGRAIDFGLAMLRKTDWIVHLDADIWLPPRTRFWLQNAALDEDCIYGIDRVNCPGYDAWRKFRDAPLRQSSRIQHIRHWLVVPPPFPLGARLALKDYEGYVPIGFFQLWHARHDRRYPLEHSTAERSDVMHPLQWPLGKRRMLPELIAVHLESQSDRMGTNWRGRKSPQFGPYSPFGKRGKQASPAANYA